MKISGLSLLGIVAARITHSSAFEFKWITTVGEPEPFIEPTQEQKEHIQAVDDQAITISGESVDIDVLGNDVLHSTDRNSLTMKLKLRGRNGYCVIHEGTDFIIYYPKHRYAGYDECEYEVCDQDGFCDSAKVVIDIVKLASSDEESTSSPDRPAIATEEIIGDLIDVGGVYESNDVALDLFNCTVGEATLMIEVQADKYGDDTTWTLTRENDDGTSEVVLAGGPYDENGFESKHVCAPKPSVWTFQINDAFGDGFCCKHGNGSYSIFLDNVRMVHVTHFNENMTNVINVGYDPTPVMTERDHEYLHAHNKRRQKWHEMYNTSYVPLQWSPKLAEESLVWANELLKDCDSVGIEHEPGIGYGENLAKNHGNYDDWGQLYPPENIVRRWVDFEETWPWPENAHLTQALWRASKWVGCGESVMDWRGGYCRVQVCRYAKSGNCDMGHYNSTEGQDWLAPMLALHSPCEPSCPPEGCY